MSESDLERLTVEEGHAALGRWHEWLVLNPLYDPNQRVRFALGLRQRVNAANLIRARDYAELIDMVVDEAFPFDSKDQFRRTLVAAHAATTGKNRPT